MATELAARLGEKVGTVRGLGLETLAKAETAYREALVIYRAVYNLDR